LDRRTSATPELLAHETEWWRHFAQAEERYSWVLPDAFQPLPRLRYLREIGQWLQNAASVVDYGCGNGWLARMLRANLSARVVGVDFSEAQINLARQASQGLDQLQFEVIRGTHELPPADAYVFHGVLHHMAADDIHAVLEGVSRRAARGSRLVFVEPMCQPGHTPDETDRALLDEMQRVFQGPTEALAIAGRTQSERVHTLRADAERRWWGEAPYGPSPMERPFLPNELEAVVGHYFEYLGSRPVQFLSASQALSIELTLLAEDDPALAASIQPELQRRMDVLERALLKFPKLPDAGWYMQMITARVL
jgi:SAM-dependent methyltransferase